MSQKKNAAWGLQPETMLSSIDCVILCGGLGSRLRSVVGESQKVMAEISGQPFLDIILEKLKVQFLKRVILLTGYQARSVEEHYRKHPRGLRIEFSREDEPLGTGGALKHAKKLIKSDPYLVFNGDSYCDVDLKALIDFHRTKDALATLVVAKVKDSRDYGQVVLDKHGHILKFLEKNLSGSVAGKTSFVNAGVYCFSRAIETSFLKQKRFSLEKDLFSKLIGKGLYGFVVNEPFIDIGTPERYRGAAKILKGTHGQRKTDLRQRR